MKTGQDDACNRHTFLELFGCLDGVLSRLDGDGRGGAALSMRAVTGAPIKFVGVGEKT
ncbi:MAG: signal recognition particle protein, partial [Pseudomonadota bacterium]